MLNTIPDVYISYFFELELKFNSGQQYINYLLYPQSSSVNFHISYNFGALKNTNINNTITILLFLNKKTIIFKPNLLDVFRYIPIMSSNQLFFGCFGDNIYWINRFLPFELSIIPYIFNLFTKTLCQILLIANWLVLHYLDGFIAFLLLNVDFILYKNYFDFFYKTLGISNNEKIKR